MIPLFALASLAMLSAVLAGPGWGAVLLSVWLVAVVWVAGRAGSRSARAGGGVAGPSARVAFGAGLPVAAALALLLAVSGSGGWPAVAIAAGLFVSATAVVAVIWGAEVVLVKTAHAIRARRRKPGDLRPVQPPADVHGPHRRRGTAIAALVLMAVPLATAALITRDRSMDVRACSDMAPRASQLDAPGLRAFATACRQRAGGSAVTSRRAGDVTVDVYAAEGVDPGPVASEAAGIVAYYLALFGPPATTIAHVHPVRLLGPVRGVAGPGYVLLDAPELTGGLRDCGRFRSSAGVEGRCGSWVLAHELAHLWFPGRVDTGRVDRVAMEGTADYLAFDWWRATFGDTDAERLADELFAGRIGLAPAFAAAHPPAFHFAAGDRKVRAVVYGRGSAAWVAAEREAGRDRVVAVLRALYDRSTHTGQLKVETVLGTAGDVAPEVERTLRLWWRETGFAPVLPRAATPPGPG